MRAASGALTADANCGSAHSFGGSRTDVRFTEAIMRKAQGLFVTKIAAEVAARARSGVRTAEYWKAGEREIGIGEFLQMLDCDEGVAFLEVFWEFVPTITRERWLKQHLLERRIELAERKARASANEVEQLRLELKRR